MTTAKPRSGGRVREMTAQEALLEAKGRWGESGSVRLREPSHRGSAQPGRLARYRFEVGNGDLGAECTIFGQGHSWAEAFEDAQPRAFTHVRVGY
jgi:hypothetical protein